MWSEVVDVAGVPVGLRASDEVRGRSLRATLEGFDTTRADALVTIAVDAERVAPPDAEPQSQLYHIKYWEAPGDAVVGGSAGLLLFVDGSESRAHLPDLAALTDFEGCVFLPLTWLLARHARFVLHGAAVERDGVAFLVLGHSGMGKSTLAAAALEAGWRVLADDVVIVRAEDTGSAPERASSFRIHGVHRTPAFPIEIGGPLTESATPLGDVRDRAELPRHVLTGGEHDLAGVVLLAHSEHDEGSLTRASGARVLPLLLQSFAGSIDRQLRTQFFATAGALSRLPVWELGHAADASRRREQAVLHLDRCVRELSA
jgi:hypothetical protein